MRTALLIGLLIAAGITTTAQAQLGGLKPYQPPKPFSTDRDPYDLPKAYNTNPYDRDYSTNRDSPGYANTRRDKADDGYSPGGYSNGGSRQAPRYGAPPTSGYGGSRSTGANRDTSRCRVGLVC